MRYAKPNSALAKIAPSPQRPTGPQSRPADPGRRRNPRRDTRSVPARPRPRVRLPSMPQLPFSPPGVSPVGPIPIPPGTPGRARRLARFARYARYARSPLGAGLALALPLLPEIPMPWWPAPSWPPMRMPEKLPGWVPPAGYELSCTNGGGGSMRRGPYGCAGEAQNPEPFNWRIHFGFTFGDYIGRHVNGNRRYAPNESWSRGGFTPINPRLPGTRPALDPWANPNPYPQIKNKPEKKPNPEPHGKPDAPPVSGPSPQQRPVPHAPPVMQPPGKHVKEKKLILNVQKNSPVGQLLNALTEGADFVEAIWDALPKKYQTKGGYDRFGNKNPKAKPPPQTQAKDIYNNFAQVDWPQAVLNLIENKAEDRLYGELGKWLGRAARKSGRPVGYQTGPAM